MHYGYNSGGRLVSVRDTTHAKPDSLTYDGLGNVASTISPLGFVSTSFRDPTGRDTLVTSPFDTGEVVVSSRTVYDLADRPTLTQSFGLAIHYTLPSGIADSTRAESLTVATVYDSGGLVRRVTRKARPDLATLDSLVTRMGYDPAGPQSGRHGHRRGRRHVPLRRRGSPHRARYPQRARRSRGNTTR